MSVFCTKKEEQEVGPEAVAAHVTEKLGFVLGVGVGGSG